MDTNDYMVQKRLRDMVTGCLTDIKEGIVNRRGFYRLLNSLEESYTSNLNLTMQEEDGLKHDISLVQAELEIINAKLFKAEDKLFTELLVHDALEDSISATTDDFIECLQNLEKAANKIINERY